MHEAKTRGNRAQLERGFCGRDSARRVDAAATRQLRQRGVTGSRRGVDERSQTDLPFILLLLFVICRFASSRPRRLVIPSLPASHPGARTHVTTHTQQADATCVKMLLPASISTSFYHSGGTSFPWRCPAPHPLAWVVLCRCLRPYPEQQGNTTAPSPSFPS